MRRRGLRFNTLSTRARILVLVVLTVVPGAVLSVYVAWWQRAVAEARALEDVQLRAELGSVIAGAAPLSALSGSTVRLGRGQTLIILDARGHLVAQYSANPSSGSRGPDDAQALLKHVASSGGGLEEGARMTGRELYAVRRTHAGAAQSAPLTVIVGMSKATAHEDVSRALFQMLAGIAATAFALVLATWYGAERYVLRPIRALLTMTQRVREGDLGVRSGVQASRDELSQLGAALDVMASQLQARDKALRSAVDALKTQAVTDSLTGLYNRRYFWDALAREILTVRRKAAPFSVIMLDIDHFKKVNDTWGHDAGDQVLTAIAEVIRDSVRGSDIAVRYGGEEFALLLPGANAPVACERAESLRQAIEKLAVLHGPASIAVTASFGVAEHCDGGDSGMALMKAVDQALYAAKHAGRNTVVVSDVQTGDAAFERDEIPRARGVAVGRATSSRIASDV